jgi:hypothetical protein
MFATRRLSFFSFVNLLRQSDSARFEKFHLKLVFCGYVPIPAVIFDPSAEEHSQSGDAGESEVAARPGMTNAYDFEPV